MDLQFLPGGLRLYAEGGTYMITISGQEVYRSDVQKKALVEYNRIRKDMESQFPARELSREEKTALLMKYVGQERGVVPRESKKKGRTYSPGSTNTFG